MKLFSYNSKKQLKVILLSLLIVCAVSLLFVLCRALYIQRYLVYTENEVKLDYSLKPDNSEHNTTPAWANHPPEIVIEDPVAQVSSFSDMPLEKLSGYYITTQMLRDIERVNTVYATLEETPDAIMLDLKSIYGNFYYSSGTEGAVTSSADISAIDSMIAQMAKSDETYLIARIASLSDTNFALAHQTCGLPLRSGALWMSSEGCYWLDPMNEDVQDYLASIARELASLGFDEVVFDDFRVPDSTNIVYDQELSREEAAAEASKAIIEKLSDVPIRISFNSANPDVAANSDRVYLVTQDGAMVAGLVDSVKDSVTDPAAEIVFLTPSRDTRFDGYSLLRPLIEERET